MNMLGRMPKWSMLAPVYGIIVLIVYSWTIYGFFWKYPSWMLYLSTGEILSILVYLLTINFLESLFVLMLPLAASIVLPRKWFYDDFVARGSALVMSSLVFFIFTANQFEGRTKFNQNLIEGLLIPVFLLTIFMVYAAGKWIGLRKIFEGIVDRTTIFLYISLPISVLSFMVVIFRNLI